jgi:hypothetical protein
MSTSPKASSARARQRADWPVRKYRLTETADDAVPPPSATERLAMMWQLAVDAWSFAGRALPEYARADTPIRVLQAGNPDPRGSDSH